MAATTAAVVAEEDTELRDLLVQTLENSGVLNRIKAELRAAVFLALEEQEKVENKTPLVNESLKKFLNTKDGRLVASLVAEFLQFFNLDFTLAVFHPETSTFQGLEGRENLARDLGIIEAEGTVGGPLLLEVIRRCQQKERGPARRERFGRTVPAKWELDEVRKGRAGRRRLSILFIYVFTGVECTVNSGGKGNRTSTINVQSTTEIRMAKGQQGALELSDGHPPPQSPEGKSSANTTPSKKTSSETSQSETSISLLEPKSKSSLHSLAHETKIASFLSNTTLDVKDKAGLCPDEDDMEGDSFFDDPIPKPEKTYGWRSEPRKQVGSLTSLADVPLKEWWTQLLAGAPSLTDSESKRGSTVLKDLKLVNDKIGSLGLGTGEDEDYVDDFNSASHRSEKSELSIGEEIEEDLSVGADDINPSDKLDDLTQDLTVSQLSDIADYLEDIA